MRLIDADNFFKEIVIRCGCVPYVEGRNGETIYLNNLINEQPTAYDVDKVVKRLEQDGQNIELIYPTDQGYEYEDAVGIDINKAKEIVKSGGIE